MTGTPCRRCDKPTDGYVCEDCRHRYARDLDRAGWLVHQLENTLTRQTRHGVTVGTSKRVPKLEDAVLAVAEAAHRGELTLTRLPAELGGSVQWGAGQVLDDYRDALAYAVRTLEPNRDHWPAALVMFAAGDVRRALAAAHWLRYRTGLVRTRPDGPDVVDRIGRAHAAALRAINNPGADRWYAGPCMFGQPPCDADLYARIGVPTVTCPKCGQHMDVAARREYLRQEAEDQLVNATDLARAVSWLGDDDRTHVLTADRVRKWAERGRLRAKSWRRCEEHRAVVIPPKCRRCQPLYRVGDAIDLLAADSRKG